MKNMDYCWPKASVLDSVVIWGKKRKKIDGDFYEPRGEKQGNQVKIPAYRRERTRENKIFIILIFFLEF